MTLATPRLNRLPAGERGITIGDFLVPIAIGERLSERARHLALIAIGAFLIALTANLQVVLNGQTFTLPGRPPCPESTRTGRRERSRSGRQGSPARLKPRPRAP